ncbi:hypothetical protein [Paenibacillus spongiae]|uniref:Beta-hexosaminidase bacterial type N-terminal domain-containing protein n=1 Tax=Paenibacillus spongiae TaxID=2909671 RepID=A0ABY5S3R0_9BACL|nr:hypothetical protein [Paenibacillus spongiae]UVI28536.1 hypothetical protein L1F29_24245 [Paenibacillus spongiae]
MVLELQTEQGRPALSFPHFPTRMQAVIWRNWGMVPPSRIADVMKATEEEIVEAAAGLGLGESQVKDAKWLERGYITIIRANWHLLPYEQLLQLLGWTEEKLAFTLKEDDFLWIKLGSSKPWAEPVIYRPLTPEERAQTAYISEIVSEYGSASQEGAAGSEAAERPFDFLHRYKKETARRSKPERMPELGGIQMDIPWTIVIPDDHPILESMVERFVLRHESAWGAKWRIHVSSASSSPPDPEGAVLEIVIDEGGTVAADETHTISAADRAITIHAGAEPGIMRGLQWLEQQMRKRGAPYVLKGEFRRAPRMQFRYIYSYSAVYGDPLLEPELNPFPDDLLERLSDAGINGVWLQSVLYSLVPWEDAPELSAGWERRLASLRALVERAARFGIGVYLYCNEPRSMPLSFYESQPDWKGHIEDGHASMCTSSPGVLELLRNGVSRLFREVPGLAGMFTITMSENLTNCYSRAPGGLTNCPRCSKRTRSDVVAEVNRVIAEGAHRAQPSARIICWAWGWAYEDIPSIIEQLPENVTVMCNSEEAIPTNVGGVKGEVIDYSISVVGPGEKALRSWRLAQSRGLRTAAKVQFNNTWECSAVPFLPVFQLIEEHLGRLNESGVSGLMLSWTLGGYPSINLEMASEYYWESDSESKAGIEELLAGKFGRRAGKAIAEASDAFSSAFREFPFGINTVYFAPQNYGPANLLYMQPTGYAATMIGCPYDDLPAWRSFYPEAVFAKQFKKLSSGWKKGLHRLERARKNLLPGTEREFDDLMNAASAAYLHFRSTYSQITFVISRNRYLKARRPGTRLEAGRKLMAIAQEEADHAMQLMELLKRDSRIGFEASNHYYYTVQDLIEKRLNCRHITNQLQQAAIEAAADEYSGYGQGAIRKGNKHERIGMGSE